MYEKQKKLLRTILRLRLYIEETKNWIISQIHYDVIGMHNVGPKASQKIDVKYVLISYQEYCDSYPIIECYVLCVLYNYTRKVDN